MMSVRFFMKNNNIVPFLKENHEDESFWSSGTLELSKKDAFSGKNVIVMESQVQSSPISTV